MGQEVQLFAVVPLHVWHVESQATQLIGLNAEMKDLGAQPTAQVPSSCTYWVPAGVHLVHWFGAGPEQASQEGWQGLQLIGSAGSEYDPIAHPDWHVPVSWT